MDGSRGQHFKYIFSHLLGDELPRKSQEMSGLGYSVSKGKSCLPGSLLCLQCPAQFLVRVGVPSISIDLKNISHTHSHTHTLLVAGTYINSLGFCVYVCVSGVGRN